MAKDFQRHSHFDAQKCGNRSRWDYVYFFSKFFFAFYKFVKEMWQTYTRTDGHAHRQSLLEDASRIKNITTHTLKVEKFACTNFHWEVVVLATHRHLVCHYSLIFYWMNKFFNKKRFLNERKPIKCVDVFSCFDVMDVLLDVIFLWWELRRSGPIWISWTNHTYRDHIGDALCLYRLVPLSGDGISTDLHDVLVQLR